MARRTPARPVAAISVKQTAVVARDDPDDVALTETVGVQLVGDGVGPGIELGVGQGARLIDDRGWFRRSNAYFSTTDAIGPICSPSLANSTVFLGLRVQDTSALQDLDGPDEIGDLLEHVPQRGHDTSSF